MRNIRTFFFLSIASFLLVCCYESKPAPKYPIDGAIDVSQPVPGATTNAGVKHYICSNNCAGSGGDAAGNCPVCGNAYVHNDAYHNNTTTAPTPTPNPAGASTTQTTTTDVNFSTPTSEPAQNAAGVWHYTCSAGCEGGAGTAGNCAKCGGALAHNAAYHQ